jgi:hypothetical protein
MNRVNDSGNMPICRLGRRMCIIAVLAALLGTTTAEASEQNPHFSTKEGRIFQMQPSGVSFELPKSPWNDWHLDRADLDKAKRGKGEWYAEYARVANAALPFENCSVQAGTTFWNGASFAGVTVRGYSLDSSVGEAENRIASRALSAAKHLPRKTARNSTLTMSQERQWDRLLIAYDVWYGDYGGRANVDFYVSEVKGKTIVLVFMYADCNNNNNALVVQQILESFSSR